MWNPPIFDRTPEDVEYAAANRGNATENKGARDYRTLNRIAGNMRVIADLLIKNAFPAPVLTSFDDWSMSDIPRESDIRAFKTDLEAIRSAGVRFLKPDTPQVPDLPFTHWRKLNDIERILYDIESSLAPMGPSVDYGWVFGMAHVGLFAKK